MAIYRPADISAVTGMVSIHAQMMEVAIPHRTAVSRLVAPTPVMAPVMVWVVLTGMPPRDAPIMADGCCCFCAEAAHGLEFGDLCT